MSKEEHSIRVVPLAGGFGAQIDFDVHYQPNHQETQEIASAFHTHQVLIFHNADLNMEQLAKFVSAFGSFDNATGRLASEAGQYTGIRVVENIEGGKFGPTSNSELNWHADRFYDPVVAGLLNSVVVPEEGGDTSFCDMYRALTEMPTALRQAIQGRRIKQDVYYDAEGRPGMRPGGEKVSDPSVTSGIETEIIQRHPRTGRQFLYLGNRLNAFVTGLSIEESEALLDALYSHIDQPKLHYRHHWQPNELILYDNRCCMHRRESFDVDAKRKLYASVVDRSNIL